MSLSLRSRSDDTFLERVSKLVPVEVLSLWLVPATFLPSTAWAGWSLVSVGAGLVFVPVLLYWDAARTAAAVPVVQYVVRSLVFLAWAAAFCTPVARWLRLDPRIAVVCALLLPLVGELLISRGSHEAR